MPACPVRSELNAGVFVVKKKKGVRREIEKKKNLNHCYLRY